MDLTEFQDPQTVRNLLKKLRDLGIYRLDSAARYPPMKPGRAEELVGETQDISGSCIPTQGQMGVETWLVKR